MILSLLLLIIVLQQNISTNVWTTSFTIKLTRDKKTEYKDGLAWRRKKAAPIWYLAVTGKATWIASVDVNVDGAEFAQAGTLGENDSDEESFLESADQLSSGELPD